MSLNINQLKYRCPAVTSAITAPPVLHACLDACTCGLFGLGWYFNVSPDIMQHWALLLDQLINSAVSRSACFGRRSCSHTWVKLLCVKAEVSASLWGILSTGQQVLSSLTCSLQQLCTCASTWTPTGRKPMLRENQEPDGEAKAVGWCLSQKLWKDVCLELDTGGMSCFL